MVVVVVVVVVAVDGVADGLAPVVGVEGLTVFVLGDVDSLQDSLRQVGDGTGGSGFYIAAEDGGDEVAEGGAEVAGGEVVAGEEVRQVFAERFYGVGAGFFLGVVEAEMRIFAGARSAATAAIRERKLTQGHAVLGTERGHRSLLRVEFWDCLLKRITTDANQEIGVPGATKQKRPGWSRGAVCNRDIVPQRQWESN
jgi:hypothetical protein